MDPPGRGNAPYDAASPDAPEPLADAGSASDAGSGSDGVPQRRTCTNTFGHTLSQSFGRLDGVLVAVVPRDHNGCNGDSSHIHLQVESGSATYDVAVNVDGLVTETQHSFVGTAWKDGWHSTATLDYVGDLGVHATAFSNTDAATLEQRFAQVNHLSVFATGYGPGGVHLVHRNGSGHDGAIVLNPLSTSPTFVVFRFPQQSF